MTPGTHLECVAEHGGSRCRGYRNNPPQWVSVIYIASSLCVGGLIYNVIDIIIACDLECLSSS